MAPFGFELAGEAEVDERVQVAARDHVHGAAVAAVAAVGTAARDELLAPEARGASPAVAGGNLDLDFVNEHG